MLFSKKGKDPALPIHEMTEIGVCLALVGGFLDAYTYLSRGGVFANAQTGNIVLMSLAAANLDWKKAGYYFIPIFAFFLGVVVTEYLKRKFDGRRFLRCEHTVMLIELILLGIIGFLPQEIPDPAVNITVSFICSMQVNSFRKIVGAPYATTMCTGNLRSASEKFFLWAFHHDRNAGVVCLRYLGIILSFCIGAAGGALLTVALGGTAVWFCCGILAIVLAVMLYDSKRTAA